MDPAAKNPREAQAMALWEAAAADWGDEKRHRAFIVFCGQTGQLPLAGRLYAAREAASPGDPATARYRDMVVAQAMAALGAPSRPTGTVGFLVRHKKTILLAIAGAGLVLAIVIIRKVIALSGLINEAAR
jgi:hypothetical protein